jgi:hypothetical protein
LSSRKEIERMNKGCLMIQMTMSTTMTFSGVDVKEWWRLAIVGNQL